MSANGGHEVDFDEDEEISSLDDLAHQSAFVYNPVRDDGEQAEPALKRRKISGPTAERHEDHYTFPRLSGGVEPEEISAIRQRTFNNVWTQQQETISAILDRFDTNTVESLDAFVRSARPDITEGRLPAALVRLGTSATAQYKLLGNLEKSWKNQHICLLQMGSGQASNLKLALKAIIRGVIVQIDGVDGYQAFVNQHKKSIPLNYDLELLHRFVQIKGLDRVVISLTDTEAFENHLLTELLSVLRAWVDRIPFVLFLQVATSIELLEGRLPSAAVQMLYGKEFHLEGHNDSFQDIFKAICLGENTQVWYGTDVTRALSEQSKEQLATPESVALSLKYALMSHCFADPLTALLNTSPIRAGEGTKYICEVVRNTSSFRSHVEQSIHGRDFKFAKRLLEEDSFLLVHAMKGIRAGQRSMQKFCAALDDVRNILAVLFSGKSNDKLCFADLFVAAMSARFTENPTYRELMLYIKRLPADVLLRLSFEWESHDSALDEEVLRISNDLQKLLSSVEGPTSNIRSTHDTRTSTHTTVSHDNKITISTTPKKVSPIETKYTTILNRFHRLLSSHFNAYLIWPAELFMSEVFIYSAKNPISTSFTPRPRYSIERALTLPCDYLGCECCKGIRDDEVRATQPATSILWRLWCEAGALVNVRDLWEAFWNVIKPKEEHESSAAVEEAEEDGDEVESESPQEEAEPSNKKDEHENEHGEDGDAPTIMDERMGLALFYRSLAELRMLGFAKPTKKKVDCVAKSAWKGL